MKTPLLSVLAILALTTNIQGAEKMQKFEPTWESLQTYKCPEWFRDAKFGIFLHWGPTSVTAFGTPYSRDMYEEGSYAYKYHVEHYGHPSKFGWKDIIPLWKAEKWDPDYTVGVFKNAGAKYIVPVAAFHDNFDLWDSKYTKWNAVKMGPKKDIIKMWRDATLKAGLRFGVSEHLERSYSYFNTNKGHDKEGPLAGVPYDGNDPKYQDFYFPPHDDTVWFYPLNPPEWWKQEWFNRIKDLVDNYKPDLLYTDGGLPFGEVGRKLMADFYNANMKWHSGKLEAVYNLKNIANHGDYREGICVEDLERGTMDYLKPEPWQTDTAIGDWFYHQDDVYKPSHQLITMLVDIVSKNGNLLLDVSLKADGTIPDSQIERLRDIGAWMKVNGDAIYSTRPWNVYGEGPNAVKGNHFNEGDVAYTSEDIRFTTKGRVINAIALGWPEGDHFLIKSFDDKTTVTSGGIASIKLLGCLNKLDWKLTPDGLWIRRPAAKPCEFAYVFQIAVKGISVEKLDAERVNDKQLRTDIVLRNYESKSVSQQIVFHDNGKAIGRQTFALKPGETISRTITLDTPSQAGAENITVSIPGGKPFAAQSVLLPAPNGGSCFKFDGKTSLVGSGLGKLDRLTLSLWTRTDDLREAWSALLNTAGWNQGSMHVQYLSTGRLQIAVNGSSGVLDKQTSAAPGAAKGWILVTVTYDSVARKAQVFIDGKPEPAFETGIDTPVNLDSFSLGSWSGSRFFRGSLADVRLFDRVLAQDEITSLVHGESIPNGLLAAWDFKNPTPGTVRDSSGHGHDLRIVGQDK